MLVITLRHVRCIGINILFPSQYVAELSLLEMEPFLQYVPSMLAAAAYCLANYTVNRALWVSWSETPF